MAVDVEKIWRAVRDYPNVVGYYPKLVNRIVAGKTRGGWSFRVYVSQKVPRSKLAKEDVLPRMLEGVPVDVVAFQQHFKGSIIFSRGFGWFDRYYSTSALFLLGFLSSLISLILGGIVFLYGSSIWLFSVPAALFVAGETLIYWGLVKLSAKPL